MSTDANRCPSCGAERPANAPEGVCPRCMMSQAMPSDTPGPADVDATTVPAARCSGHSPETQPDDPEATGAYTPEPFAKAASARIDATGDWTTDPGDPPRAADDHGPTRDLPRGATVRYFGDYEIQKELGRGGMGVVYKARQISLNRPVALKMIKAGVLADVDELRRFQNEAEAVALLDHAGIVPVYEVGEHEDQRYFSMKLVEGSSLADQLALLAANPRAAATLLAETAEAVHHAHMRGILHRDLKPANILIDSEDHPHVTDFGLAKRVDADVELTASGAILGTPAYMSPEQASGRRGTITTATDVYGLGAILYALVTGEAPFGGESLVDTLQAVKERPPRLPRNVNANVPRDLETICLKCLAKDPRRRYASAQALADDLRCWLDSRPIAARRVGPAERAWLWCKRKPAVAALAASVMLVVIGGTTGIFAVQARANASLRSANGKLDHANTELKSSNIALDRQRTRAEEREKQAIDAVKRFRDAVADNPDLKNNPALESLRKSLLKEPLAFFQSLRASLQADGDTRPESLARLASAAHDYADITAEIGDKEDSLRGHVESQAIWESLAKDHRQNTEFQAGLAKVYFCQGKLLRETGRRAEAKKSCESAVAIYEKLSNADPSDTYLQKQFALSQVRRGILLENSGPIEAMKAYESAVAIFERLIKAAPTHLNDLLNYQSDLAGTFMNVGSFQVKTGKPAEALESYGRALAIQKKLAQEFPEVTVSQSSLAGTLTNMGTLQASTGKSAEAMKSFESALEIWRKLTDVHPTVTEFQNGLATIHMLIAGLQDVTKALESQRRAAAIWQKLIDTHPTVTRFRSNLAGVLHNMAGILNSQGRKAEALALFEQARSNSEAAVRADGKALHYQVSLANHLDAIGILLRETGKPAESIDSFRRAITIRRKLVDNNPGAPSFRSSLAGTQHNLARLLMSTGDNAEALALYEQARSNSEAAVRADGKVVQYQIFLANHHSAIGDLLKGSGKLAEAFESFMRKLATRQKLAADHPADPGFLLSVANCHNEIALLEKEMGKPAEAMASYEQSRAIDERLTREHPESPDFACGLAGALSNMADLDIGAKRFKEARTRLLQAITLQKKALAAAPRHPTCRAFLTEHLDLLIKADKELGRAKEAAEAQRALQDLKEGDPGVAALDARLSALLKGDAP
ncbi:MAG: protein kinase domain-containing protein [Isosphaeraceae bacterium]